MKLLQLISATAMPGLAAFCGICVAQAGAPDPGWYIGANIGLSQAKIDREKIAANLMSAGFSDVSIDDDEREFGYKVFGGYQFNRFLALEGGYFDLGEFGFAATMTPPGTLNGDVRFIGMNLDIVGIWPLTDRFSALGRIGANHTMAKSSFSASGAASAPPDRDLRKTGLKAGVGIQYDLTPLLGLRLEAERYRIDDAVGNDGDVDLVSLGLISRFGSAPPEPAAPPPPVTQAPEPEPVSQVSPLPPPPPQPPAPRPSKIAFSADALFDFDSGRVKPSGREALDQFAADLQGTKFQVITVTGHTDRIGRPAYNLELSARRAEAVKSYLVETAGIPADKITARGMGEAEPVTRPGDCNSPKTSRASSSLITCLQPDRRVEVEVSGTR